TRDREYLSFEDARTYAHSRKLKNWDEWDAHCKSGDKPSNIPCSPKKVYKGKWKGNVDWLGTENVRARGKEWLSFGEAREIVRSLGIKNQLEWHAYCKSGKRRSDIPSNPREVYKDEWKGLGDWLGFVNYWNKTSLLALLEDLRSHINVLSESELYML